jgi:hypothetical protein
MSPATIWIQPLFGFKITNTPFFIQSFFHVTSQTFDFEHFFGFKITDTPFDTALMVCLYTSLGFSTFKCACSWFSQQSKKSTPTDTQVVGSSHVKGQAVFRFSFPRLCVRHPLRGIPYACGMKLFSTYPRYHRIWVRIPS